MKASKAVKITKKVLTEIKTYASLAAGWDIIKEDDYQEFKDVILDIISGDLINERN